MLDLDLGKEKDKNKTKKANKKGGLGLKEEEM